MKLFNLATLFIALSLSATLPAKAAEECVEKSLVQFTVDGKEFPSQLVGADTCDDFGGNLVYSPKYQRYIFVNFNIAGTINLDEVDAAFGEVPFDHEGYLWISAVQIAVVSDAWIKSKHPDVGPDQEAFLNMGQNILFVNEKAVNEGRFGKVMQEFYGLLK